MIERVVDAHIHLWLENPKYGEDLTFTWDDLKDLFDKGKLARALVMTVLAPTSESLSINKKFFEDISKQKHQDKIWGYYWPHPKEVDFELAAEDYVSGIKFHPSISQTTVDKATDVLKVARDNGKPLLIHCGRNEKSRIDYLLEARKMEPDIIFIGAHLGGLANDLILVALKKLKDLSSFDNLYLDTSGCMNPKILRRAIEVMGDDRILWGTDAPFFDHDITKEVLKKTGVPESSMRKILYENAIKLHEQR